MGVFELEPFDAGTKAVAQAVAEATSKGAISINILAERFGGGGHKKAAGATLTNMTMDEAVKKVIDALIEFMSDDTIDS